MNALFTNDNNVTLSCIEHSFSSLFANRDRNEPLFRKINTYLILQKIISRNIIDLGAWIGDNALPWAKNISDIVYAIDPSSENCFFMRAMCAKNNISNVKIMQVAISNKNETLITATSTIDHCTFVPWKWGEVYSSETPTTHVSATYLDYLYEKNVIKNIGYIHLDVEGMEYEVLQGSSNLIDECRPIVAYEQHLELDNCMVIPAFLREKNYMIFLVDEILPDCRTDCRNFFAFPKEIYSSKLIEDINSHIGYSILLELV